MDCMEVFFRNATAYFARAHGNNVEDITASTYAFVEFSKVLHLWFLAIFIRDTISPFRVATLVQNDGSCVGAKYIIFLLKYRYLMNFGTTFD